MNTPNASRTRFTSTPKYAASPEATPATIRPFLVRTSRLLPLPLFSLISVMMPTGHTACHQESPCYYPDDKHATEHRGDVMAAAPSVDTDLLRIDDQLGDEDRLI